MPRYLFVLPDNSKPRGGDNVILQIADVLNENGFVSGIVFSRPDHFYKFFASKSETYFHPPLRGSYTNFAGRRQKLGRLFLRFRDLISSFYSLNKKLSIKENDVFVIPEFLYPEYCQIFPNNKKILFVQNCFSFLRALQRDKQSAFGFIDEFVAILSISDACEQIVRQFCSRDSHLVSQVVCSDHLDAGAPKKRQIAYMPRKRSQEVSAFVDCLDGREELEGWTLKPIDNVSGEEAHRILSESLVFLSFSHLEGFGLPPAEAMAAGCIVIGYTGVGGEEYFELGGGFAIPDGDMSAFAEVLTCTLRQYETDPKSLDERRIQGSKNICEKYSFNNMRSSVISIWQKLEEEI